MAETRVECNISENSENADADFPRNLRAVVRNALVADKVVCGFRQVIRLLDTGKAVLCLMAAQNTEPQYTKLLKALCVEKGIPLVTVNCGKTLAEFVGLVKMDENGKPKKGVMAGVVALSSLGPSCSEHDYILKKVYVNDKLKESKD
ncbi:hypothetical protein SNEBB_009528 [Seison nebaliae]|nr:hypothetical protein SNEBB_009528 [Seison nebaliae]